MRVKTLYEEISEKLGVKVKISEPLSDYTAYSTGGNAAAAFFPKSENEAKSLVKELAENGINYAYLGNGTNVLVSDDGFDGAVIITSELKGISISGSMLKAHSGDKLSEVLDCALYNSLGGIEFLCGIPASLGGAIAMNAGCYGKSIGDYVLYVTSATGIYKRSECGFGYRTSRFSEENDLVISACLSLENVEYDLSENKSEYYRALRRARQPKGRSCGSVFKNDGYYAGKVIESCNLKGYSIGKASVSEKHANFIIAEKGATSRDISRLIAYIKSTVKRNCGVELKEEIRYIGKFCDGDNV